MLSNASPSARMILLASIITACLAAGIAPNANAAVTYTASATTAFGNPLSALSPGGDIIIIDITLRSDGEPTMAASASAFGYDPNVVRFVSGEAVSDVLVAACLPSVGCVSRRRGRLT